MKHLVFAAGILGAATAVNADAPELTVYTYDSFVSDWGPGPQVKEAFEAQCNCTLNLVGIEDGAALLSRGSKDEGWRWSGQSMNHPEYCGFVRKLFFLKFDLSFD